MTIGQVFLKEVDAELNASRPLLERVPGDKVRRKPHQKSAPLGHLTQLVCETPSKVGAVRASRSSSVVGTFIVGLVP